MKEVMDCGKPLRCDLVSLFARHIAAIYAERQNKVPTGEVTDHKPAQR
jgi:hypothetical protein